MKSTNIRGDHPLNLNVTNLAMHAYMLTHEAKYRAWLLEYVDAWRNRIEANGGNIPSNIGLDGTIGGEWGGKWYGGVFGWDSPDTGLAPLRASPVDICCGVVTITAASTFTVCTRDNCASPVPGGKSTSR